MRKQEESICLILVVFFHSSLPFALRGEDDRLPPPTELSYEWLDPFTVNVSWRRPNELPDRCAVKYRYGPQNSSTVWTNFIETLLTDDSSGWTVKVRTAGLQNCGTGESASASIVIDPQHPPAQLMTDFKCFLRAKRMECSWIPSDRSVNLTLSYRICDSTAQINQSLEECDEPFRHGVRDGCHLSANFLFENICMLMRSNASTRTFRPEKAVDPPKLHVNEEGDKLNLRWTPPEVAPACRWTYKLCYSKCNDNETCQLFVPRGEPIQIAYDKSCRYVFRSRVTSGRYCSKVESDFSAVVAYGVNEARVPLTAVAVAVAIIMSVGILLACYCFTSHSAVLFPDIPDPSAILKDMMMSGSTEIKASTNFYTPVPETIQPCKIMGAHEVITPAEPTIKHNSQDELPC
ncbi:interleukin-13 receptor subunit alpha-1-like [Festucalex cinctus]